MKTGVATVRKTRNYIDNRRITHAAELFFHRGSRFVILRGFDVGDVIIYSKNIPTTFFTIYEENENSESVVNNCKCATSTVAVSDSGKITMNDMEFTLSLNMDPYQKIEPFGVSVSAILSRGDRFRGTCNPVICSLKSISALSNSVHEEIEGLHSKTLVSSKSHGPPQKVRCDLQVTDIQLPHGENPKALSDASESKQGASQPSSASRLLNISNFHPKSTHSEKNTVRSKLNTSIGQEACSNKTHSQNTLGTSPSPKNVFNVPQIDGSLLKEDLKMNTEGIKETCEASSGDVSKNKNQYMLVPGLTHMPTKNTQESQNYALSMGRTSLSARNTIVPFHIELPTSLNKGDSEGHHSSNEAGTNIISETKNKVSWCKPEKSSSFLQPDQLPSTPTETFHNPYISVAEFEVMRKFARIPGKDVFPKDSKLDAKDSENSALNTSHRCGSNSLQKTSNDPEVSEKHLEQNNITNIFDERHILSETPRSMPSFQRSYISFQELETILKKKFPSEHNANHDNSPATVSKQQKIQSVEKSEKCPVQATLTVKTEGRTSEIPVSSKDTFRSPYISLEELEKFKKEHQPPINNFTSSNKSTNITLLAQPTKIQTNASAKETSVTHSKHSTSHNSETNEKQFNIKKSLEENEKISEPTLQLSSTSQTSTSTETFSVIQKTVESKEGDFYSKNEDLLNTEDKNVSLTGNPALVKCYGINRDERNSGISSAAYNSYPNTEVKENPPEPPPRPPHTFRNPYMTVPRLSTMQKKKVDVLGNGIHSEERSVRAPNSSETSMETSLLTSQSNGIGNRTQMPSLESSFKPSTTTHVAGEQKENTSSQCQLQKSCGLVRPRVTTTSPSVKADSLIHSGNHLFYSNPVYSEGMHISNPIQISPKSSSAVTKENFIRPPHCQDTNRSDPYYHSASTVRAKLSTLPPPPSYPAPSLPPEYTSNSITSEQSSVLKIHTSAIHYSNIDATHRAYKNVPPPPAYPAPTLPQEVSIYSDGSSKFAVNSSSSPSLNCGTSSSAILRHVHEPVSPSNNSFFKTACKSEPKYENLLFQKYELPRSRQKPYCTGNTSGTRVPPKNKFSNNSDSLQSTCKRKSHHCNTSQSSSILFRSKSSEVCSNDCKYGKKKSSVWSVFKKEPVVVKVERTFIKPVENPQRWQQSDARKKQDIRKQDQMPEQQGYPCVKENQEGFQSLKENEKGFQKHESKSTSKQTRNPLGWFKKKSGLPN